MAGAARLGASDPGCARDASRQDLFSLLCRLACGRYPISARKRISRIANDAVGIARVKGVRAAIEIVYCRNALSGSQFGCREWV
jgi:hypothetical protein